MGKRADTVLILAIVDDQIIILSEQQPGKPKEYTLPGGRVDLSDHSWLDAAKREMREETGMEFKSWRLIEVTQPTAKLEWFCPIYLAYNKSTESDRHLDGGEKISVKRVSVSGLKSLIYNEGRSGLGHLSVLFETINTISDLQHLPEFVGVDVTLD